MTLVALFAGVFLGVGLGIVFRYGGTTGGADIIAKLGFRYFGWSMGKTLFAFDCIVIASSLIYLNYREAMYTLLAVFVAAKVIDLSSREPILQKLHLLFLKKLLRSRRLF